MIVGDACCAKAYTTPVKAISMSLKNCQNEDKGQTSNETYLIKFTPNIGNLASQISHCKRLAARMAEHNFMFEFQVLISRPLENIKLVREGK